MPIAATCDTGLQQTISEILALGCIHGVMDVRRRQSRNTQDKIADLTFLHSFDLFT